MGQALYLLDPCVSVFMLQGIQEITCLHKQTGNFKHNFAAISNRPCKLLAIPWRFESPVVCIHVGDLKSRLKSQQKSPGVTGPLDVYQA